MFIKKRNNMIEEANNSEKDMIESPKRMKKEGENEETSKTKGQLHKLMKKCYRENI